MHKVMAIYGTRPEAIKMAPLIGALAEHSSLTPVVTVTGQHREMLDQVNSLFGIVPDYDLDLMSPGATLTQITSRTLSATSELLERAKPDCVVVQGDTTSAFTAALGAFYHQIPVVHLEAGLRTGNIYSPFPEEVNRRLTAPIAALHLAPTATSKANLEAEGIASRSIAVTGNTVIDALQSTTQREVAFSDSVVEDVIGSGRRLLLVTSHRRESWGDKMAGAMEAVRDVAVKHPELLVLLPMHRNRIVREVIEPVLGDLENVRLTEPLSYHEFAHVLNAAHLVLTDSGGVQEEAPSLGKPVLVMRDTTERPEAVAAGTVKLVGTDRATISEHCLRLLEDQAAYAEMANAVNPYGDGRAAERSVAAIGEMLGVDRRVMDFGA
ncbi:UDP-N-acetylglucosamine 2-epimerase (non-hydrolysing) [Pedococcus cremeus]|uniref:UDP-N-acetylglucosamine 2-epimerase (non-hydrolyzing) n=1 Tax=Pedococcus cremeus TaxID=587636 RepID=A0A1H9RLC1_9MICO|nr:UDP-N-acetylglucosamine 2-epimerase (non-hydrolyzing) [Pedococcus cremeus]SER73550.1 UDP-N-acetylglucosamine 2-epimerase (non-hydrolysing) [Pedococcus cremeus]